jgi:hypothetical protein
LQGDVTFLLKKVDLAPLDLTTREENIQSGKCHYSAMIGAEDPPTTEWLRLFHQVMDRNLMRLAGDFIQLALQIEANIPGNSLVLVSIARSGIPVGVVLTRLFREYFKKEVSHYSISVIRDLGVDKNALAFIGKKHPNSPLVFIDGWTGKGVISRALAQSLQNFPIKYLGDQDGQLAVLTDLAGLAFLSAGQTDYLIPTALLNSTVSGLISRTIYREDLIGPRDFHGCKYYEDLKPYDLSTNVVETIMEAISWENHKNFITHRKINFIPQPLQQREKSQNNLLKLQKTYGISDSNLIKPGLGEAIRVLLRRVPRRLIVQDPEDLDVVPLLYLAEQKKVPITLDPQLPYRAVALIQKLKTPAKTVDNP